MNELQEAALERAKRSAIQYVCATIPSGIVVTPAMLQNLNIKWVGLVAAAWLITGVLDVAGSYFMALKTGLPEADDFDDKAEDYE